MKQKKNSILRTHKKAHACFQHSWRHAFPVYILLCRPNFFPCTFSRCFHVQTPLNTGTFNLRPRPWDPILQTQLPGKFRNVISMLYKSSLVRNLYYQSCDVFRIAWQCIKTEFRKWIASFLCSDVKTRSFLMRIVFIRDGKLVDIEVSVEALFRLNYKVYLRIKYFVIW